MPGLPLGDLRADSKPIGAQARERSGYPTWRPFALPERIAKALSNRDDAVLGGFCGCGTALAAAARCNRQRIGIDLSPLASQPA